jgi:hypothetical protein
MGMVKATGLTTSSYPKVGSLAEATSPAAAGAEPKRRPAGEGSDLQHPLHSAGRLEAGLDGTFVIASPTR